MPRNNNIIFIGKVEDLPEAQHVLQSVIIIQMWRIRLFYLILPWNGHAAGVELAVEGIIRGIQINTFHRGELLDVQNIFSVNRTRL